MWDLLSNVCYWSRYFELLITISITSNFQLILNHNFNDSLFLLLMYLQQSGSNVTLLHMVPVNMLLKKPDLLNEFCPCMILFTNRLRNLLYQLYQEESYIKLMLAQPKLYTCMLYFKLSASPLWKSKRVNPNAFVWLIKKDI